MKLNLNDALTSVQKSRVYVLHGTEECYPYISFALDKIQKSITNVVKHQFQVDRYFKFDEVNSLLDNVSLFTEQNLIDLNFKTKPTLAQEEDLIKLINKIDENSFLFITTDKLTNTTSNWLKAANEAGSVIAVSESDTASIISYMCSESKLKINNSALNLLLELNSGNIPELMQETTRLTHLYPDNYEISVNDIQSSDNVQYNIYQLSNAYLSGNLAQSQKILDNIYHEAADAILITWLINEDIKKLLKIKARQKDKINIDRAISELRVWGDAITNLKIATNRISYNSLLDALDQLSILDMAVKGINNENVYIVLLQIIELMCSKTIF